MDKNYDMDAVRDETGRVLEGPFKHLRVLERRCAFLKKRIKRADQEGRVLSHDQHEADALDWAIDVVYTHDVLPQEE